MKPGRQFSDMEVIESLRAEHISDAAVTFLYYLRRQKEGNDIYDYW